MSSNTNNIQQLYVAYFGRPADATGLAYWETVVAGANGNTTAVSAAFAASAEYTATFAGLSNDQIVNTVYNNLFHRDAEVAGLTYWSNKLTAGAISISNVVTQLATAAQGTDATALAQKVAASVAFTAALDTTPEVLSYNGAGAVALAKAWLAGIYDAATEAAAVAATALNATIASLASAASGQAFSLTTGTDNIVGTANNDTITASALAPDGVTAATTLNTLDVINGGSGIDTLVLDTTGGKNVDVIGTITNVENLTFVGSGAAISNVDATPFSGTIKYQQTADTTVAVTNVTGQTIATDRVAAGTTVTVGYAATQTSANLTATTPAGNLTYSISGAGLKAANLTIDKTVTATSATVTDTGNTITKANITASGATTLTVTSAALADVSVAGAGAVTLTTTTAPTTSVNASSNTGGLTLVTALANTASFTGGSGADTLTEGASTQAVVLGAGNDSLTWSAAALGTGGSADGGDGTDTITLSAANIATATSTAPLGAAFAASISNFEKLGIGDTAGAIAVNASYTDGITYFTSAGTTGGTLTFSNGAANSTLELTGATAANASTVTFGLKDATGQSDVFNLVLKNAASDVFGTVAVAGVETLNITSTDSNKAIAGTVAHSVTVTDTSATSIVVTGNANLTLVEGSTALTSINASGLAVDTAASGADTLGLTFASGDLAAAATATGSAGVDSLNFSAITTVTVGVTINGGLGGTVGKAGDTLIGGAGADTITFTGLGNATLTGNGGADTITGSTGDDTITGGAKGDTLVGGAGNDIYNYTAVSDSAPSSYDTITGFTAKTATAAGDVIQLAKAIFGGAGTLAVGTVSVATNGSLALAALGAAAHTTELVNIALDSSTGTLYIDGQGVAADHIPDGTADMAIILSGLTTITASAFTIV